MKIMVLNPDFPKDRSKARDLSQEQFAVVHDYIIGQMNKGKPIKDGEIVKMLIDAGKPLDFSPVMVCCDCKKTLKKVEVGHLTQWKAVDDEDQTMAQYCWADPAAGSNLHEPIES